MKKQVIIKTYERYMNAISFHEVATEKVDIAPFIDTRVGKKGKLWYVWEFTTGAPIVSSYKTRIWAIAKAKEELVRNGPERTSQAIAMFEKINV